MDIPHIYLCDEDCNNCALLRAPNARQLSLALEAAYQRFGDDFYAIIQHVCPNMTACRDCHIDDFTHIEGCEIAEAAKGIAAASPLPVEL